MARRHTSTEKWDDPWFRKLSPELKCTWLYIVDKCDNVGVWQVDEELLKFYIGEEVSISEILPAFNNGKTRIKELRKDKWLIVDFVSYHWAESPKMLRHIELLRKHHGLNDTVPIQYKYSSHTPVVYCSKVKYKGGVGGKPTIEEIRAYIKEKGSHINPEAFFNHYETNGWVQGKNKPIKDWKACLKTWELRDPAKPKIIQPKQPEYKTDPKQQEEVSRLIHETAIKIKSQ